jgi:hypothetical protein
MRIPRSFLALPFVLAAACALSAPAFSQPKTSGADDAQQADEHFRKGKELVNAGRLKEAREEYLAAFRLRRSYDVAGNLGSVESSLGMPRDAAEHLSFAIHNYAASGTTPEQLERAKTKLVEAERQVGTVKLSVNIDGAEVIVDGKSVGRAPLGDDVFVDVGERTIEARLAGYESAKQTIKIAKAQALPVKLMLVIASPPVPTASAVPLASASASAGPPPVPSSSTAPIVPVAAGGPSKPVLITGGVVTGLAVVAGVVFTVIANGKATDAAAKSGEVLKSGGAEACGSASGCGELHGLLGDRATFSDAALRTFVGAGVLGAATVVYALAAPRATSKAGLRAVPMVSASGGGIVLGGAW